VTGNGQPEPPGPGPAGGPSPSRYRAGGVTSVWNSKTNWQLVEA
jgi:hypothetical protein